MKSTIQVFFNNYFRGVFCLTLLCSIIYFNSLQNSFHFDDSEMLEPAYTANLETFLKNVDFLFTQGELNFRNIKNRPLLLLTYALNNEVQYHKVFGFHLINLLFHSLTTILIFYILRSLQFLKVQHSTSPLSSRTVPVGLAFLTAAIFSTHPLSTQSVVYISGRASLSATFFSLFSLYCFIQIFVPKNIRTSSTFFWSLLVLLSFYLGLASKLIAGALPAILGSWFIFVICPIRFPGLYSLIVSKRMITIYILGLVGTLLLVSHLFFAGDSGIGLYGRMGYLLIQTKIIIFYYLRLFFFPVNQSLSADFPFSTIGEDPWISASVFALLTVLTWVLAKGNLYLKVSVLCFIFALAPTSSIIPLNDLIVEHRMYFPMATGLCLIGGVLCFAASSARRIYFTGFLLVSLGIMAVSRNQVWINDETLWWDDLEKNPKISRAYNSLGNYYYNENRLGYAVHLFEKSVLLNSRIAQNHLNLANSYFDMKRLKEAEHEYWIAIRLDQEYSESALFGLGGVYMKSNRPKEALEKYREAIKTRHSRNAIPYEYPLAQLGLGRAYGALGRYEEAIRELATLVKNEPHMYKAFYNLGLAYMKLGRMKEGEKAFLECLKINPSFKEVMFNLGQLHQRQNHWEESSRMYRKFLEVESHHAATLFALGINALQIGDIKSAKESFRKTLDIDPKNLNALINLGNLYARDKNFNQAEAYFLEALKIKPNVFQIHMQLGNIALRHRRDNVEALDRFNTAFELASDPATKRKIRQIMTQLSQP